MPDPTRRTVLSLAAATTAAALTPRAFARAAPTPALAFLAVGDWGRDGSSHQQDVANRMGETAARIGSKFTVSVGDNFYERGVQTIHDAQWRTSFEDVYKAPSLQTPWYVALGNHDYRGVPQAQVNYTATSRRWKMPARYFTQSFAAADGQRVDLFVLDTSPMVKRYDSAREHEQLRLNVEFQNPAAQLRWLDAALAASPAQWKIVAAHHPVFSGGSGHGSTPELIADVKPLLERHGVQLYLNGHDHDLQHIVVGPVTYICTGAGSETRSVSAIAGTRFASDRSGFTAYRIEGDRLTVDLIDYTGKPLHQAVVAYDRIATTIAA